MSAASALRVLEGAGIPVPADPLPEEPKTEFGYANRLIAVYGGRLRYVAAWKRWLLWDGTRWVPDETGSAARWMKAIGRRLTADAIALDDPRARDTAVRQARRGESAAGVSGALTLASTEAAVVVTPGALDADPFLLNCQNGTMDLRTGALRKHDPADLITKVTGADYNPDAPGAVFGSFLRRVQPDEAMRAFLARLLGHALEGRVTEHVLPIFHGDGGNGKSTLVNAVMAALGDYAAPADPDLLTARSFDSHPTSIADLCGLRLAILHESDAGRRLGEGTVKRLTGGDRLKARRMREDFWSFDPSHTFIALTNHKPVVTGTDEGIWRRLRLVPWDVVIPVEERDETLPDRLTLERPPILAWLVAGYLGWREHGLGEPERVAAATAAYRAESDVVARFLEERCLPGHGHVGSTDLFRAWEKWCTGENEDPGTQKALAAELENRGFDKSKDGTGRMRWRGLSLASDEEYGGFGG